MEQKTILDIVRSSGFTEVGITKLGGVPCLVCALPYGNSASKIVPTFKSGHVGIIAPFARFNYYKEAVVRLKKVSRILRCKGAGSKSDYRIFCNSRINEKQAAEGAGIGELGRNNLIITKNSGSMVIIAAMTIPIVKGNAITSTAGGAEENRNERAARNEDFVGRGAVPPSFKICECCKNKPLCAAACPTKAINGDGKIVIQKCVQWYASGNGDFVPQNVLQNWGDVFYGCTKCGDVCPHNKMAHNGVQTELGALEPFVDVQKIVQMSDNEIKAMFKGSAMGLNWLTAGALRRNAMCVLYADKFKRSG